MKSAIKHIREQMGLSQSECARRYGCARQNWRQWEMTCPRIMMPTFFRICTVLEIPPAALIELIEKGP